jgi:membrane protein implicated in regulation of membrane protease activity
MAIMDDLRTVPELISHALSQVSRLIHDEIQLAKAEISNNLTQAAVGVGMLAGGAVTMIAVLVLWLLAMAAWFVQLGLSPPIAYLLAGVAGAVIAGVLAWLGMNRLKPENLTPRRTIEQLQRDAAVVKEHVT